MAMEGLKTCSVPECIAPLSGYTNLCNTHRTPGAIIRIGKSTMVITTWYAEHANECGVILLNDFALGDLFGGQVGFEKKLARQGFVNVRLLLTPTELEEAKAPQAGKRVGNWSGPWNTQYAWESRAGHQNDPSEDVQSTRPIADPTDLSDLPDF
jgi:hypothetical protein